MSPLRAQAHFRKRSGETHGDGLPSMYTQRQCTLLPLATRCDASRRPENRGWRCEAFAEQLTPIFWGLCCSGERFAGLRYDHHRSYGLLLSVSDGLIA